MKKFCQLFCFAKLIFANFLPTFLPTFYFAEIQYLIYLYLQIYNLYIYKMEFKIKDNNIYKKAINETCIRARARVNCKPKQREKATEPYLVSKVRQIGGMCVKLTSPGMAGIPDRLCLFPGGIMAFVELKSEGEKPRKLQQAVFDKIRKMGFRVEVCDTKQSVDSFISSVMDIIE